MAGLLVLIAAVAVHSTRSKIQQRRSPLLQLPPVEDTLTQIGSTDGDEEQHDSKAGAITEYTLAKFYRKWLRRELDLLTRLRAFIAAKGRGAELCWAGPVSDFERVLAARDEARFVRERFEEAIDWCNEKKLKRTKWAFALGLKRDGTLRNQHDEVPPALYFLPLPFPRPPPDNDYTLRVLRPPQLGPRDVDLPPPPPVYSEKLAADEELMQRAGRDEQLAGPST